MLNTDCTFLSGNILLPIATKAAVLKIPEVYAFTGSLGYLALALSNSSPKNAVEIFTASAIEAVVAAGSPVPAAAAPIIGAPMFLVAPSVATSPATLPDSDKKFLTPSGSAVTFSASFSQFSLTISSVDFPYPVILESVL